MWLPGALSHVCNPIPHMVKRKAGEFSDKLLSLQRGLRQFQGKHWEKHQIGGQARPHWEVSWLLPTLFSHLSLPRSSGFCIFYPWDLQ